MIFRPIRPLVMLLMLVLAAGCATTRPPAARDYDLRILNGRIIDGTGSPAFRADVGVRGDRIVAIGNLSTATSARTIDAGGNVVAPGFIDLLGQSQTAVLNDSKLEGKVRQGVTTEVTGEGFSPGPITEAQEAERKAENPNSPTWRTLGDYFRVVEKKGTAINFAFFVGASNPRTMVIGRVNRVATEAEMQEMERIVAQAMQDGAIGLSTSLIYIPAVFSTTEEIIRLALVARQYGGVYFSHIRSEDDEIVDALEEAFRIGREASIPVNIWHLKTSGRANWGRMPEVISRIVAARESGLDVAANVYPYAASSTNLAILVPNWSLEGGYEALLVRLQDPEQRVRIHDALRDELIKRGEGGVLVTRIGNPEFDQYEKKTVDQIAAMMNLTPAEATIKLYESVKTAPQAIFFSMREDDMKYAIRQPFVSVGADSGSVVGEGRKAGAHPRAYGTFPRVIGRFVREDKLFTLEEAVRKITSQAASRVNLWDRGILRPGMKADVVVFDPVNVNDVSTYDDPHQFSVGISDVIVNGTPVLLQGTMTGQLPGRILRNRTAGAEATR